jgi:TonB family protein
VKSLIILFTFLPLLAWAQDAPPPPAGEQSRPHYCGMGWYPKSALKAGIEGTTTLSFHITETGDVRDIEIAQSSGNDALDSAARQCARNWLYHPALLNGKPIEATWKAQVVWKTPIAPPLPEIVRDCAPADPASASHPATQRTVNLSFNVEPDGTVKNVTIIRSSGDTELDSVAVACLKARLYKSPVLSGEPTEIATSTSLTWRPESANGSNSSPVVVPDEINSR